MQFSTMYSSTFFFLILASTKLVASAPLPYDNLNSGGIDAPEFSQVGESVPKPIDAVPECEVPNVTTLPTCLANPAVEECTKWVEKVAAECVEFSCPVNEDQLTCITMLQSAVQGTSQTKLAQCYEAKVKEVCPINAPTIPTGIKRRSTSTLSPEAPGVNILKEPTTSENKLPGIKTPETEVSNINVGNTNVPQGVST
ncbi:hypothetical protein EV426DRAFT_623245 [Tirmania nivea]|nr:hypothetical protein EV426DRAFT_623245 [Tirmania nivea]